MGISTERRRKLTVLYTAIRKARAVVIEDNARKWFARFKDRPWFEAAVAGYVEITEQMAELLHDWERDTLAVLDREELFSQPVQKAEYRTEEYLDERYNRVVVDDVRDELEELKEQYQSRLEEFFDAAVAGGLMGEVGKALLESDELPFNFNKYNTFVRDYMRDKKIHWGRQVADSTEKRIRKVLVDSYEKGLSSYDTAQKIRESAHFSALRAEAVARTESMASCSYADYARFEANEDVVGYRWRSHGNSRTRSSHRAANRQFRAKGEPFDVGASKLLCPGDNSLGAASKEIVNCRCWLEPVFADETGDLKPEERKRIEAWRAARAKPKKKKHLGLGSGKQGDTDGYSTITEVFEIDYNDRGAVEKKMESFRSRYLHSDVENALIISPQNIGVEVTGWEAGVNIELADAETLKGAVVIHNHPKGWFTSGDCFSDDDLAMLMVYEPKEIRLITEGVGGFTMRYTGDKKFDDPSARQLYHEAFKGMCADHGGDLSEVDFEQLETIRKLTGMLEGFEFEEWEINE